MADWEQVIVGAGSSALTFLYAAARGSEKGFASKKTLVIGEEDLWQGAQKGASGDQPNAKGFEMGQPADLLYPLNQSAAPTGNVSYLQTSKYNQSVDTLKQQVTADAEKRGATLQFLRDRVTHIKRFGQRFSISTAKFTEKHTARQVIIASGAGPNQSLATMNVTVEHKDRLENKGGRTYPEVIDGESYVKWHPNKEGLRVLVYGPAPTAAWAAAHALYSKPSLMMWMARSSFKDANPAGRNSAVILHASEHNCMFVGTVQSIDVTANAQGPRLNVKYGASATKADTGIPLRTEGDSPFKKAGKINVVDDDGELLFDQFVYATGADPTGKPGPAQILEDSLRNELVPYYDKTGRFKSEALVAFATKDRDLWVVGASVFRALGRVDTKALQEQYQAIPQMFSEAGTPPEGLAVVKALIKSVTNYDEPTDERFNWNTADRLELAKYLRQRFQGQLDETDRTFIADEVIKKRSAKRPPDAPASYPAFGLTKKEFQDCVVGAAKLKGKSITAAWQVQQPKAVRLTGR
jgi:hypothetical protein